MIASLDPGCYIVVFIAPLGTSFIGPSSGEVYDQQHTCLVDASDLDVDSVLYREAVKPPPTTAPPTTLPPTTAPPTTVPPTTTTVPKPVCIEADKRIAVWGTGFTGLRFDAKIMPWRFGPGLTFDDFQSLDISGLERIMNRYGDRQNAQVFTLDGSSYIYVSIRYPFSADKETLNGNPASKVTLEAMFGWHRFKRQETLSGVGVVLIARIRPIWPRQRNRGPRLSIACTLSDGESARVPGRVF